MDVPALWKRAARAVLAALVLVTAFMGWQAYQLEFNYDFEQFFPADHPETQFYRDFRDQFGSDNDFLIVGFEGDSLSQALLAEVDGHVQVLRDLPAVESVQSPTRLDLPVRDQLSGMAFQRPLLDWADAEQLSKDLARLRARDDVMGNLVSPSGRAVALTLQHAQGLSKAGCDSLAAAVLA